MKKFIVLLTVITIVITSFMGCGKTELTGGEWTAATYKGYTHAHEYSSETIAYFDIEENRYRVIYEGEPELKVNDKVMVYLTEDGEILAVE